MNEIYARKIIEDGEEIIELDLNKPWPKRTGGYPSYMDDVERMYLSQKNKRAGKEFIEILS